MLEQSDFLRFLLLLTTALGLSFTIETAQAFWLQAVGAFAGIALCHFTHFGLFNGIGVIGEVSPVSGAILSGILIGGDRSRSTSYAIPERAECGGYETSPPGGPHRHAGSSRGQYGHACPADE
ncbi:MAG: hypothetical protein SH809_05110 [Rhodothermales bacterium]|nr:hypothetical protein [Rhodothermales bacterium]